MGDSDNLHFRRTEPVNEPERKASQNKPTMIRIETGSERLVLTQSQTGSLDIEEKFLTEARYAILVVAGGSA
jgi:hypothetical protein